MSGQHSSYLWQVLYEVVNVGRFSSYLYLLHGYSAAVVAVGDVFG